MSDFISKISHWGYVFIKKKEHNYTSYGIYEGYFDKDNNLLTYATPAEVILYEAEEDDKLCRENMIECLESMLKAAKGPMIRDKRQPNCKVSPPSD